MNRKQRRAAQKRHRGRKAGQGTNAGEPARASTGPKITITRSAASGPEPAEASGLSVKRDRRPDGPDTTPPPGFAGGDPWLLSVAQVCRLLNLSRSTVDRMARRGELPGRMKLGGQVRYDAGTLRTWLDEQQSGR